MCSVSAMRRGSPLCAISKEALRQNAHKTLAQIPSARRVEGGQALFYALQERLPERGYVLSFVSLEWEISLKMCNDWLFSRGQLALPCVSSSGVGGTKTLQAKEPANYPGGLRVALWGGWEPLLEDRVVSVEELQMVLVPGLLFDVSGGRLGHGWGCYDRFLCALLPKTRTLGVGFQEQLFTQRLPLEEHDILLEDLVLV